MRVVSRAVILLMLAALLTGGCSWFKSKEEPTAAELVERGMESYNKGRYRDAIEAFEKLRDWYPFSKYAILAELKVADAYYEEEEYDNAIYAYEQFENLHPRNEAVPHVIYRIGMCYFHQIYAADRDQTGARQALQVFERLVRQHPDTPQARDAAEKIKVCVQQLAKHDMYVGIFYFKNENYAAALERFESVLENYPDVGVHKQALEYIERCRRKLQG